MAETLIMMACSATKMPNAKRVPALDLYDGPLWQTLRTHLPPDAFTNRGRPGAFEFVPNRVCVCVLSGKYGFINARTPIDDYDARLTEQKADRLIKRGIMAHNDLHGTIKPNRMPFGSHPFVEADATLRMGALRTIPYEQVIVVAADPYLRVFESFGIAFQKEGLIAAGARLLRPTGGIGEQRGQLGQWLREMH